MNLEKSGKLFIFFVFFVSGVRFWEREIKGERLSARAAAFFG
jgi:hypothetical protein